LNIGENGKESLRMLAILLSYGLLPHMNPQACNTRFFHSTYTVNIRVRPLTFVYSLILHSCYYATLWASTCNDVIHSLAVVMFLWTKICITRSKPTSLAKTRI